MASRQALLALFAGCATTAACVFLRVLRRKRRLRGAERFACNSEDDLSVAEWSWFRETGRDMVDFMVDYYEDIEKYPVRAQVEPGYLQKRLAPASRGVPEAGEDWRSIMRDVEKHILPGMTHWQHPRFFAYYPANSTPPAVLGEMLSCMLNAIGFSWEASPAETELETIVMDQLAAFLGLPDCFLSSGKGGGVIQGTASEAVLVAVLAARCRALRALREKAAAEATNGAPAPSDHELLSRMTLYASDQAHSCITKAAMIAGLEGGLRLLAASAANDYAVSAKDVADAMAADCAKGLVPMFLCANVGTTSTCAIDPVAALAAAAESHTLCWLHVDAAYAGSAACCPEYRAELLDGVASADSFCMNPHKWLLTNFDCSALFACERSHLLRALTVTPEILRSKEYDNGLVHDYRDWQVPLGRKFRALKLYFVFRCYGARAIRQHVRRHCALAEDFAKLVGQDSDFEIVAQPRFGLVCFRLKGSDEANQRIREELAAAGRIFLVNTKVSGRYVLRFAVGSPRTEERHVSEAWHEIKRAAAMTSAT